MKTATLSDGKKCTIRPYTLSDYQAVQALLQSSSMFDTAWDSEESLRQMIQKDPNAVLVVTIDEAIIASVYVHAMGHWVYLWRLVTASPHRQQGVATTLLEFVEQMLRNQGAPEAAIFVSEKNDELKDFYAKRGWQTGNIYRSMWKQL